MSSGIIRSMSKKTIPKLIADEKIPLVTELFGPHAQIIRKSAAAITRDDLMDAQLLLIRSVTPVNAHLLQGTSIQWVGAASAGTDHIDREFLKQNNISLADALSCNAVAVAEYVVCCIAGLKQQGILTHSSLRAGVIGVGYVGAQVVEKLLSLGFEVICNDPPREKRNANFKSTPLDHFENLDLICLHSSLNTQPPFATYHLIDHAFLQRQKPGCVLLNAARGAVLDSQAALQNDHIHFCLDVWENEPHIQLDLLNKCILATPHIAGGTLEAKYRATFLLYQQAQKFFNWQKNIHDELINYLPQAPHATVSGGSWKK